MSSCYSEEFTSSCAFDDFVMTNSATEGVGSYITSQQVFIFFGIAYIVYVAFLVINWIKKRFDMAYRDIHDQQKELIDRTQEKLDKFMARYGRKLHVMEEENRCDVREHTIVLEAKIAELQTMLKNAETTINNLRSDVSASNSNLSNRLLSIHCQTLKDQHELEDAQNMKSDELTNDIDKLTLRLNELENQYALTNKYIQEDDALKQVLIGYKYGGDSYTGYRGEPIFCPKYTNELDKYLGNNRALIMLSGIAQLPRYRTFTFADYFYKRENGVKPASSFLDLHMNVVANAVEWGRAQEVREPELVSYYKSAFERVYDYCKAFGVKCV